MYTSILMRCDQLKFFFFSFFSQLKRRNFNTKAKSSSTRLSPDLILLSLLAESCCATLRQPSSQSLQEVYSHLLHIEQLKNQHNVGYHRKKKSLINFTVCWCLYYSWNVCFSFWLASVAMSRQSFPTRCLPYGTPFVMRSSRWIHCQQQLNVLYCSWWNLGRLNGNFLPLPSLTTIHPSRDRPIDPQLICHRCVESHGNKHNVYQVFFNPLNYYNWNFSNFYSCVFKLNEGHQSSFVNFDVWQTKHQVNIICKPPFWIP